PPRPDVGEAITAGPTHLTRFSLTTAVSGTALPSTVLSFDCRLRVSASTRARRIVAVAFLPSCRTEVVLITHLSPSFVQAPSPKPPVASKIHERTFLAAGSQPTQWVARPTETPRAVVENVPVSQFWLSAQDTDSCSPMPFSSSAAQSPTIHSSPRRCS